MSDLTPAQLVRIGKACDAAASAKLELEAATIQFEAACVLGGGPLMTKRTEAVHTALQNWMDATASKYEIARRINYG